MKDVVLHIPAEIAAATRLPPDQIQQELCRELALALYRRRLLSVSKACALAAVSRWEFEELLGQREAVRHYTQPDLEEDLRYAFCGQ
jgi:predicted HTH domain antitoxin